MRLELVTAVLEEGHCVVVVEGDVALVPELPVHVGPALPHLWLLALEDLVGVDDIKEVDGEVERDRDLLPHVEGQAAGVDAHILEDLLLDDRGHHHDHNSAQCS